jgi:ribosomal-protein-alanine N-acetyltransferase
MENNKDIETPRLILRERSPERIASLLKQSAPEQMQFLGLADEANLEFELQRIQDMFSCSRLQHRVFDFLEKEHGTVVGNGGFHTWFPRHARAEIGYYLHEPFRNKGYMTEALSAMLEHGFTSMQLNRVEAFVGLQNPASLHLMHRFGFVREGLLREHYDAGTGPEDSLAFSLLKSEYFFDDDLMMRPSG